jgi:hypothetical protein
MVLEANDQNREIATLVGSRELFLHGALDYIEF